MHQVVLLHLAVRAGIAAVKTCEVFARVLFFFEVDGWCFVKKWRCPHLHDGQLVFQHSCDQGCQTTTLWLCGGRWEVVVNTGANCCCAHGLCVCVIRL